VSAIDLPEAQNSHHLTINAEKALFYIIIWPYQFNSKPFTGKMYENTW
jgi:hypothetical protein